MIEYLTWSHVLSILANIVLGFSAIFNYHGKLSIMFPLALVSTILFIIYGIVARDYSFIVVNIYFLFLNVLGIRRWTLNKKGSCYDS